MERLQETRHALGSNAVITLVVQDNADAAPVFAALWRTITEFEQRFSRFLPQSELSQFNAGAGSWTPASEPFREMLTTCQRLSRETAGLYNPFILPDLQRAGYVGSWPNPQAGTTAQDYRERRASAASAQIKIRGDSAKIPAGTALDFGGIGKGYLLDLLAAQLKKLQYGNYWLSLGGDIICSGNDLHGKPWAVGIQHASKASETIGSISNKGGQRLAIATSGVTKRKGANWHHIIDPRTGEPASTDLLTATLACSDATHADVYAKCLVILGSQGAAQFCKSHHITTAYLQIRGGDVQLYKAKDTE
ncbi:MAG TPA: FAD:protein FMN transferase [Candidatus Saccharimonadales bacterium]|nr:FAD:protein FMN transferase [Candidatus Saccharimonadales bacterium]